MYIQPLQAIDNPGCYHVGGDVTIHPSATIAPGALIRAEANCKVVIGSAVCVGMGVIIHACEGDITIESGANLGAAVLIVGYASIGGNACVGSSTTIRNSKVDDGAIVPAASLIGELGEMRSHPECLSSVTSTSQPEAGERQQLEGSLKVADTVDSFSNGDVSFSQVGGTLAKDSASAHAEFSPLVSGPPVDGQLIAGDIAPQTHSDLDPVSVNGKGGDENSPKGYGVPSKRPQPEATIDNGSCPSESPSLAHSPTTGSSLVTPQEPSHPKPSPAFGKSQVNRLMKSLFPHSTSLDSHSSNGASPSEEEQ